MSLETTFLKGIQVLLQLNQTLQLPRKRLKRLKGKGTNQYFFITSEEEIDQKYENVPFLRYVETATGHIHELDLKNNTVSKISNTTIPKIHEAFFDKTGSL